MVLAHADNEKNIMCIHAGFEKNLLIKAIGLINPLAEDELRANTQKGSNEGAEFIVPIGEGRHETWYVKFGDGNPDHVWNEVLADRLYGLVVPEMVPETKMIKVEGRLARASRSAELPMR